MYYYPRRPIKSFQDLEVYQRLLAIAVVLTKRLTSERPRNRKVKIRALMEKEIDLLLDLPVLIAQAHSLRFSEPKLAISKLEEVMLNCNLSVVYLEQFRDLANHKIEPEFFEEQIKALLINRNKVLRLQRSWKKFMEQKHD